MINIPSTATHKTFHLYDDDGEICRTYRVYPCTALIDIGFVYPELQDRVNALLVVADMEPEDVETEEHVVYNWDFDSLESDDDFCEMMEESTVDMAITTDYDVLESIQF